MLLDIYNLYSLCKQKHSEIEYLVSTVNYFFKLVSIDKNYTMLHLNKLPPLNVLKLAVRNCKTDKLIHINARCMQEIKSLDSLPGPRSLPFIGQLLTLTRDKNFNRSKPHEYWKYFNEKYGPMVRLKIPQMDVLVLFEPDDFQTVIKATDDDPQKGMLPSLKAARHAMPYFGNETGIITEENEEWARVRKRVQTPILKPKIVSTHLKPLNDVTLEFIERIEEIKDEYDEVPSNFADELKKWASECTAIVGLNRRLGNFSEVENNREVGPTSVQLLDEIFDSLNHTEVYGRFWKIFPSKHLRIIKKGHEKFIKKADAHIQLAMKDLAKKSPNDTNVTLIEALLATPGLTNKDVVTIILDLMFAGVGTTYASVGFTLYLLARNPQVQKKLQEEVDSVLGGRLDITNSELGQMHYLRCVVKESLRLYPVGIGIIRILNDDLILRGYRIPKGQQVLMPNLVPSRKEDYFARANEFIPERWFRDKPLGHSHPYANIPFGFGRRMCIGRRIFETEIYVFLIRAMQKYNVGYNYKDFDFSIKFSFYPSEPFKFKFTRRE